MPPMQPVSTNNFRGALLLVAAMAIFTIEAAATRWYRDDISTLQIVFFRGLGQFVVVFGWAAWRGAWPVLRSRHIGLHLARGVVSVLGWFAYYLTFQKLDVGLATLLTFASSLFVVVLAGPVLGEKVSLRSWIATLTGFAGIALASDLLGLRADVHVFVGLASAALSAAIVFLTRSLAQSEDTITIMAWIGIFVLPVAGAAAWLTWQPIAPLVGVVMLLTGTIGAFGMVLMIEAYARAEAGALAPIPYLRIALAMLLGYVLFGEVPSVAMVAGAAIVVVSALFAMRTPR